MVNVEMYSTAYCPYCIRAKQLLIRKGVRISREIALDRHPELRAAMVARSGRKTVPQIFINGRHVGGFDDLAELERSGALDGLLRGE